MRNSIVKSEFSVVHVVDFGHVIEVHPHSIVSRQLDIIYCDIIICNSKWYMIRVPMI